MSPGARSSSFAPREQTMDKRVAAGSLAVLGPLFSAYTFKHALVQEAAYQTLLKSAGSRSISGSCTCLRALSRDGRGQAGVARPPLHRTGPVEPGSTTGTARASGPKSARRTSRRSPHLMRGLLCSRRAGSVSTPPARVRPADGVGRVVDDG